MKIKNIDAFREELFKNIQNLWFDTGCDIHRCARTIYEYERLTPENKNIIGCRALENVLVVEKYHRNNAFKKVRDTELYITINEDGIIFHKNNSEEQRFVWWGNVPFNEYSNKMEFAMEVAIEIVNFVKEK